MSNNLNSIQINTEVLRTVLETLLKNDSTNQDLQEYLIIKSSNPDLIYGLLNLISKIVEEANGHNNNTNNNFDNNKGNSSNDANKKKILDEKTKNLINLLFNVVFLYFIASQKIMTVEQTFNFVAVLNKKKLIEEKMLNEVILGLTDKVSNMDSCSLAKFLNFALENDYNLKATKKLKNNLINLLMKSNDAKIINEIILFFARCKDLEFLSVTNLDFIFKKLDEAFFNIIDFDNNKRDNVSNKNKEKLIDGDLNKNNKENRQFDLGNKIKMLWNVSNLVEIIKLNFDKFEYGFSDKINIINQKKMNTPLNLTDIETDQELKLVKSDLKNFSDFFLKSIKILINSEQEDLAKLTIFEISLIFDSLKNFQKFEYFFLNFTENLNSKFNLNNKNDEEKENNINNYFLNETEFQKINSQIKILLEKLENIITANLKQLGLIEFLLIFSTYCEKRCISDHLTEACLEIIVNSLDQFSLYQLDLISYSLENNNIKDSEVLGLVNRMKIFLTKKIFEKSVEDVDVNIIKESINEIIADEMKIKTKNNVKKQFKKLI
jgi:hypothetical protein